MNAAEWIALAAFITTVVGGLIGMFIYINRRIQEDARVLHARINTLKDAMRKEYVSHEVFKERKEAIEDKFKDQTKILEELKLDIHTLNVNVTKFIMDMHAILDSKGGSK